jgi:hypothetical protein
MIFMKDQANTQNFGIMTSSTYEIGIGIKLILFHVSIILY